MMLLKKRGQMKKLIKKMFKKKNLEPSSRITTDTVAEHRERILAGGRRFKYPLQYSRHKLVINAIIISIVALLLIVLFGWWRLYVIQDTGEFFYRVTRIIPLPVASVDGQPVLYSDYLMAYRSSVHYSEQKEQLSEKTDDGKKKIAFYKQQSMQGAIANAYAAKLAKKLSLSVSDSEIEGFIKEQRQSINGEISQKVFDESNKAYLGLDSSEIRYKIAGSLLQQKVAYAIDKPALDAANKASDTVNSDQTINFRTLATNISNQYNVVAIYGSSGLVPKTNQDGGLAVAASKLSKGQISPFKIKSTKGDGYFIIRLLDINNTHVSYEYVNIPLTKFDSDLNNVIKSDKLKKYISV